MKNNLNIAFCFFGQVRFFEVIEVYRNWRNSDILFQKVMANRKSMKSWQHNRTPKWGINTQ
jgi:hypothetical protein